jgi:hypothetical protein
MHPRSSCGEQNGKNIAWTFSQPWLQIDLSPELQRRVAHIYLLPASRWFLAWFILRTWRWRWYVLPKRRLAFIVLCDVISHQIYLLVTDIYIFFSWIWTHICNFLRLSLEEEYFLFWPTPTFSIYNFQRKKVGGTDRLTDFWLLYCHMASRDGVAIDGVWVGSRINCTLTDRIYKYLRQSHWVTHSKTDCNYSAHKAFSVFTSRCLVAASNSGLSPSSGFPNSPQPQLPASHFSQLQLSTDSTTVQSSAVNFCWSSPAQSFLVSGTLELLLLVIYPRHGTHWKCLFYYSVFSLPGK